MPLLFVPDRLRAGLPLPVGRPREVADERSLQHKQIYLNVPFFWARAASFFVLWRLFAFLLDAWSRRQDETGDPSSPTASAGSAAAAWWSTASPSCSPPSTGSCRSSRASARPSSGRCSPAANCSRRFAFVADRAGLAAAAAAAGRRHLAERLNDLGNLLLTFLVIWAYMVWFQFMLIWIANLPYEVIWYLPRVARRLAMGGDGR